MNAQREEVWKEYKNRREQAAKESKGKSKGEKGKEKGKGKGKGKSEAAAKAAYDQEARCNAVTTPSKFPRQAVGLDNWANVHLQHERNGTEFPHQLNLAHGHCKCRRDTGRKGVPRCFVPWVENGENIDLFPEGFLVERGCDIVRGASQQLTTPKGRVITILLWGTLPYIMKDDLNRILTDLPEIEVTGRSGQPARNPTAARVLHTCRFKDDSTAAAASP